MVNSAKFAPATVVSGLRRRRAGVVTSQNVGRTRCARASPCACREMGTTSNRRLNDALGAAGLVVVTGKSGQIYLLRATHLDGVGGQLAEVAAGCGNVLDGGAAHQGDVVYPPCASGPMAVRRRTAGRLQVLWRASGGGPLIVVGRRVWSIGTRSVLYGFDATTGVEIQHASLGALANHFSTPSVGEGLLLAPIARQVVAFTAH